MKITFVGGGNMASAMIGGLIAKGMRADDLSVIEVALPVREQLIERFGVQVFANPHPAALTAQVLVLATKPQQMREAAAVIAPHVGQALVLSVAAGVRAADISRWLAGYGAVVRAMPNTPAMIHQGITGLYALPTVSDQQRFIADRLVSSVGEVVWCNDESQLDAITAVSGSGPAYVFHFIEALEQAAVAAGLPADAARRLAVHTVAGAGNLAVQSKEAPETLRAKVTSKGGTTEAAMATFDAGNFRALVASAVAAAAARAKALGDEHST
jgi:pyrroline-5-carboxylate reductase